MRSWLAWLVRERLLEVAIALALGTALATFAGTLVDIPISALVQHVGRDPFDEGGIGATPVAPYYLNFSIGSTVIAYGEVLTALVTLGVLTLAAAVAVRRRDRELGVCPFCASRIPYDSTHCAYCGSGVAPGEP